MALFKAILCEGSVWPMPTKATGSPDWRPTARVLETVPFGSDGLHDFEAVATGPLLKRHRDPGNIEQASFIVFTLGATGQAKGVLLYLRAFCGSRRPTGRQSPG